MATTSTNGAEQQRAAPRPHLRILGIRGVPANHGGFETFAERLAPYLVEHGWKVTVYCQEDGRGPIREDVWNGVHRVLIPSGRDTALNTIIFDLRSCLHARKEQGVCLTLGYNTAVFMGLLKRRGIANLINMDGIEYARAKWGPLARLWFRLNERAACWLADHLIADHPEIKKHLLRLVPDEKVTVIPYGADPVPPQPTAPVEALGLEPGRYVSVVARAEPENSLLEIVNGFSARPRGVTLAVLGRYDETNAYHQAVRGAASDEVSFLGPVYDKDVVRAFRYHSLAYIHGHRVGGSNPSLIEALAAGNPVIAHDNRFNRWVAGDSATFFVEAGHLDECLNVALQGDSVQRSLRQASLARFESEFGWLGVLSAYQKLLQRYSQSAKLAGAVSA